MAGTLRCPGPARRRVRRRVSIDSRTLRAGDLFFAIVGERLDGHRFVAGGARRRARPGVVVSDPSAVPPARRPRRRRHPGRRHDAGPAAPGAARPARVGRAGRRRSPAAPGKTTTKEMTADLLGARYRVFRNHGNFNNHIGLPLSLLELRHGPRSPWSNSGMNHAGEIRAAGRPRRARRARVDAWWPRCTRRSSRRSTPSPTRRPRSSRARRPARSSWPTPPTRCVMARVAATPARVVTFGIDVPADVSATDVRRPRPRRHARDGDDAGGHGALSTCRCSAAGTWPTCWRRWPWRSQFGVPLDEMVERARGAQAGVAPRRSVAPARRASRWSTTRTTRTRARCSACSRRVAAERGCARRVAVLGEMLELGEQADGAARGVRPRGGARRARRTS